MKFAIFRRENSRKTFDFFFSTSFLSFWNLLLGFIDPLLRNSQQQSKTTESIDQNEICILDKSLRREMTKQKRNLINDQTKSLRT